MHPGIVVKEVTSLSFSADGTTCSGGSAAACTADKTREYMYVSHVPTHITSHDNALLRRNHM